MADWYLPDVITNPGGTLLDVYQAFPYGVFSMFGHAPAGSKAEQLRAVSSFVPAKVSTVTLTGRNESIPVKQYVKLWTDESAKTSPEAKRFWREDTKPELFPGFDFLTGVDWGKILPIIALGVGALFVYKMVK